MNSRLVNKDQLAPNDKCHRCRQGRNSSDAWLSAGYVDPITEEPILLCSTCTNEVVRGLGLVTLDKLQQALAHASEAKKREAAQRDELREIRESNRMLTVRAERAEEEVQQRREQIDACHRRIRELENKPTVDAREQMLAQVRETVTGVA